MIYSLHSRLIALVGASVLMLFLISGIVICWLIETSLWSEFDKALRDRAMTLSQLVEQERDVLIFEWMEGGPLSTPIDTSNEAVCVWQNNRLRSQVPDGVSLKIPPELSIGFVNVQLNNHFNARARVLTFQPRVEAGEPINFDPSQSVAVAKLAFARSTATITMTISRLRIFVSVVGLVGLISTLAMTRVAVNLGLQPLDSTTARIASIDPATLDTRVEESHSQPRELQPLIRTINSLLSRIQTTIERERAFAADVAHELRTPLAGLRAKLDVALSKPRSIGEHEQTARQCLAMTKETASIVESLLATTHKFAGEQASEPINVAVMIAKLIAFEGEQLKQRELCISQSLPESLTIFGAPEIVAMLLRNLICNAVEYADPKSNIHVAGFVEPDSKSISFQNKASEFCETDIAKVFERFWRGDQSRTATGRHSGLGLPLCKRLIESLGGTIAATYKDQTFEVRLRFEANA